jgi:hypothetical protein
LIFETVHVGKLVGLKNNDKYKFSLWKIIPRVFLEIVHPAKFIETVEGIVGEGKITIPEKLAEFMKGEKKSLLLEKKYKNFREFLIDK